MDLRTPEKSPNVFPVFPIDSPRGSHWEDQKSSALHCGMESHSGDDRGYGNTQHPLWQHIFTSTGQQCPKKYAKHLQKNQKKQKKQRKVEDFVHISMISP